MSLTIHNWPFLPEGQRTPEQNERWWAECYVPSPADVTLHGIAHSVIAAGGTGSGKSTALRWFEKAWADRLLLVRYPVARWPGEPHAWVAGYGHLGQIMACSSMTIKKLVTKDPSILDNLSEINLEYMRWLIEKYTGKRAFRRWVDTLNCQLLTDTMAEPFEDIYPSDADLLDVQGQIEELVTLSRRFGYEGVGVLVDVNRAEIDNELKLAKVEELFGWLTPLQFEGFAIKAALPEEIVEESNLIELSRGRISFASLRWSSELCRELTSRLIRAATDHQLAGLTALASDSVWTYLEDEIQTLYGESSPRVWVHLTRILLDEYLKQAKKLAEKNRSALLWTFYAKHVPLRIDRSRQAVWRGKQEIPLDDQPFIFLETLWVHQGKKDADQEEERGDANRALLEIAGSQGNLNTIASRLRKKIEPFPENPIYLQNSRSQGYWLEHVIG